MLTPFDAFTRGDYLSSARHVSSEHWQYWASLAAIGRPAGTTDALLRFSAPEAAFYAGVAAWMEGNDERALALLRQAPGEHAARLADLIGRRPLTVLSQLPWNRGGVWDVLDHLADPAFRLLNVSFHPDDIENHPYADVHRLVPAGVRPDFFLTEMLEWHLIPPNIRDLGCPVIGHSSDYDIHIQAIAPWLAVFDEILVLDSVQWRHMSGLAPHARVSVFPKVFGIPRGMANAEETSRPVDVFLSGTVLHPYHADKDAVVLQLLDLDAANLRMVNGFDAAANYYRNLASSKVCVNYVRHPGGLPTRALEGLALGCVAAVQEENVLHLFFDRSVGVVPYGTHSGSLAHTVRTVLANWDEHAQGAARRAALVRDEFALAVVASQYLRFATVVAARPRTHRRGPPSSSLVQKRGVVQKGWLPSYAFGGPLLRAWAASSVERLETRLRAGESAQVLNDIARERLLDSYHAHGAKEPAWLPDVTSPLERAVAVFPRALVPRLNLIRILVHFGRGATVRRGVALLDETLEQPPASWDVELLDDVLPWDFCPSLFNYRRYFDTVVEGLSSERSGCTELIATILASLHYYRAHYAAEAPGPIGEIEYAARATAQDPDFADYVLYYCRLLLDRGLPADAHEAARRLERLAHTSARLIELVDLSRRVPPELRGPWYDALLVRATRFWLATEMRENLPEPRLQSALDDQAHPEHPPNPAFTGSATYLGDARVGEPARPAPLSGGAATPTAAPYLSIVLTGRNDNFGGDFNDRLFSALRFNHRRLTDAGVRYDIVFVEWRPVARRPLLGELLRDAVPDISGCLTTYEVDERYHAAFSQNPRLQFHEFIAKNVGIRRANGSYVLATNTDVYFSRDVVTMFAQQTLRPMVLYRATRMDLKSGLDRADLDEFVLSDRRNHVMANTLTPPAFTNAAGDFLLLDRFSWHALRGFNEVYRAAKLHIDANFCHRARASGVLVLDSGASVYHVGDGTFQSQRQQYGKWQAQAPWGGQWHKAVLYENPSTWGLGEAPVVQRRARHFRIEFDYAVVPPLVSLRGITGVATE